MTATPPRRSRVTTRPPPTPARLITAPTPVIESVVRAGREVATRAVVDGRTYKAVNAPCRDDEGAVVGVVSVTTDITAEVTAEAQRRSAEELTLVGIQRDPLTGVQSRAALIQHLNDIASSGECAGSLLLLDLDDFNLINDSLGHAVGDMVLMEVASRVVDAFPGLMVARSGGDEFAVVAPSVVDRAEAVDAAERVHRVLGGDIDVGGHALRITASVGLALEETREPSATLIRNAGSALSSAKRAGRGQYRLYDVEMRRHVKHRLDTQAALRVALTAGQLHVEYQPIVGLADRITLGSEALLRWNHPQWGQVSPAEFIPVAEQSGLILPIGDWVMTTACADALSLHRAHGVYTCVNVSARQLIAGGFAEWVEEILERTGLPPQGLVLEVTESIFMDDVAVVRIAFERLRSRGVRVSIDDFGTGYSSLARLQRLPVDMIKLGRAFVSGLGTGAEAAEMAQAILKVSTAIGADIVAEGVETEAEAATLLSIGYTAAQGFLFGRPMSRADLSALLGATPGAPGAASPPPHRVMTAPAATVSRAPGAPSRDGPAHLAVDPRELGSMMTRSTSPESLTRLVQGTRALLRASTEEEVVEACCSVVRRLGGTVSPARLAGADALPLDLSFGHGEPLLACAATLDGRQRLEAVLPDLAEDARVAVARVRRIGTLESEATVDGLTGLLNRRSIDRMLARVKAGDTVLVMDLDHFKEINDHLGHATGDAVLIAFARVLREQGRAFDWLGRLGGDEFVAILPGAQRAAAERLLERLEASWAALRPQPITFSAGVAIAVGGDAAEVLARADQALYQDKASRRHPGTTPVIGEA